jgi:short-subunit dehydrogenase
MKINMNSSEIKEWIIVGSSMGLGAALVDEFLKQTSYKIIGIARTKFEGIKNYKQWIASGRYRHIEMDVASPQCREVLKDISITLSPDPVCIIFNAALTGFNST